MGQVGRARELAETLLAEPLPRRWAHTQGVAATARRLAPILDDEAELLEAAAWLHDIGYSPGIVNVGFHPLDGARYLRELGNVAPMLCCLVAYHTGAIYEAKKRGLEFDLTSEFTPPPQLLADALTYCDITTGPDGDRIEVAHRLIDIQNRYGSDHCVGRAVRKASASYVNTVREIESRLAK